ncbi:LysM peptidoglycan-binding domain-containing protein, partial [Pseudomonas sp. SDO528_S397]
MSSTYTVKSGDTLGEIARRHGVKAAEIQALNPIIKDPNHICPGWALKLPGAAPKPELPPPMHANNTSWTTLRGQPECQQELVDVVHITGEPHFYVLTEQQSNALKKAISAVQTLMDELHQALSTVPADMPCKTLQDPEASCPCAQCVKEAWSIKAEEAGVLTRDPKPRAATAPSLSAAQRLQEDLATLQQARDWYQDYAPGFFATTRFESNWTSLQARKILELDREIGTLRATLATQKRAESPHSSTSASSAGPDLKRAQKAVGVEKQQGIHSKTGVDIVEIILFSDPTRRHYIPMAYRDTTLWITRVPLRVMAGKPFNRQLATDLIKDIRQAIGTGRKTSVLGGLELKISSWTSQEDNLLNALHREASWTMGERDAVPYAVSAEAHAWRFAASASAGVNNWNPKEGNIDVGVKSSATFSFGEASGSLNRYFPSQGGYVANMAYRNALGQEVRRPFGVFRLSGTLALSCFTGVKGQVEAGVQTQYKPTETPAGATALLGTPTLEVGRSGNIGVKCEGFVGAQAGGALSGSFDWVEPDKYGTGKIIAGQANASSNWVKLAEVKMEGNVAWGVGGSGEFGISIANDRLAINCKASLVLGPGAGGGFGTVVDIEQVGKLVLLFCNALADMDYRHLLGVTQDAFSYLASGLFRVMTSPG